LEVELRRAEHFATKIAARAKAAAWIEGYNTRRRHSSCQQMPPAAHEQLLAAREEAAWP
jgi:transposase InsO family protein